MKLSRILIVLAIICGSGLLLFYGVKLQAQNKDVKIATKIDGKNINIENIKGNFENLKQRSDRGTEEGQQTSRWGGESRTRNSDSGENSSFYQVIIDYSLFRPLGWKPPNEEPEYSFEATTIATNGTRKSEASFTDKRSNRFYTGNIGDEVGGAIIKEIKEKEIVLDKDGETITLRRGDLQFLSEGGSNRGNSRENRNEDNEDRNESESENEQRNNRRDREVSVERNRSSGASEMRRRFQSASREERMRMIQQFRERSGRGRRGSR